MTASAEWAKLLEGYQRLRTVAAFVVQRPDRRRSDAPAIGTALRLSLTKPLADEFKRRARARIEVEKNTRVVVYDPGYRPERGEVAAVRLTDVIGLRELCESASAEGIVAFGGGEEERSRLIMYGTILGRGPEAIVCLQQFTPKFTLRADKLLFVINRAGIYGELEEDGFAFDLNFDLFVAGGFAFALDNGILERVLGYAEGVRLAARQHADSIVAQVPMANAHEFVDACCKDQRFARKAAAIVARRTFGNLILSRVLEHADKHHVRLHLDGQGHIVFSNQPSERWVLLKLLDDDYLESSMTDSLYEVNSKLAR